MIGFPQHDVTLHPLLEPTHVSERVARLKAGARLLVLKDLLICSVAANAWSAARHSTMWRLAVSRQMQIPASQVKGVSKFLPVKYILELDNLFRLQSGSDICNVPAKGLVLHRI